MSSFFSCMSFSHLHLLLYREFQGEVKRETLLSLSEQNDDEMTQRKEIYEHTFNQMNDSTQVLKQ